MAAHCSVFRWGANQAAIAAASGRTAARRPGVRASAPPGAATAAKNPQEDSRRRRRNNAPIAGLRRSVLTIMLTRLLRLLTAVDRLIETADRYPAGLRRVVQLVRLGCCGAGLVVLFAALELARMAVALAGG